MLKQHLWLFLFLILLADSFADIGHFYCGIRPVYDSPLIPAPALTQSDQLAATVCRTGIK